jgi:hypothetical protein
LQISEIKLKIIEKSQIVFVAKHHHTWFYRAIGFCTWKRLCIHRAMHKTLLFYVYLSFLSWEKLRIIIFNMSLYKKICLGLTLSLRRIKMNIWGSGLFLLLICWFLIFGLDLRDKRFTTHPYSIIRMNHLFVRRTYHGSPFNSFL